MKAALFLFMVVTSVQSADLEQGKTLYEQSCVSCHGDQGQGASEKKLPKVNGHPANYLSKRVEDLKHGKGLTSSQMADVAAYLSQLKDPA